MLTPCAERLKLSRAIDRSTKSRFETPSLLDVRTIALALAATAAILGFLLTFVLLSDRFGAWPAGVAAIIAFVVVLPIARRYLSKSVTKSVESKPLDSPPPAQTTIVQTPVTVNVPVNVRVEREREISGQRPSDSPVENSPPAAGAAPAERPSASEPNPDELRKLNHDFFDSIAGGYFEPSEETLFEDTVVVGTGREGCWKYELPLERGDLLEADLHVVDGEDINWSIMSKGSLFGWLDGGDPVYIVGEENVRARDIKWTARKGKWYFVLDAFSKRYPRKVSIRLRWVRKKP